MNNKQDFTQGSIFGKIMKFMLPILGALVLQAMYGAVDMLIVGRFGSNAGITAVSTGSQIMNMVTFVLSQLAAGVMILIGRYLGEKRNEKIGKLIGNAVAFFSCDFSSIDSAFSSVCRAHCYSYAGTEGSGEVDSTVYSYMWCGMSFCGILQFNKLYF